jgi:CheY-like chemotaxis protein
MSVKEIRHLIMLIEDNPIDVDLTVRAFKRRKLINHIQIVRDGEEAIGWIQKWKDGESLPVVILLDLKLPRIDGLDVLRAFKKENPLRSVPVVILTTSSDDRDIRAAYEIGANSYIVKPVDFDKFMRVAEHIELYWNVINKTIP